MTNSFGKITASLMIMALLVTNGVFADRTPAEASVDTSTQPSAIKPNTPLVLVNAEPDYRPAAPIADRPTSPSTPIDAVLVNADLDSRPPVTPSTIRPTPPPTKDPIGQATPLDPTTQPSAIKPTPPINPSNPGGSNPGGSNGGNGGGGSMTKDNCPSGDFSASYYDGKCGSYVQVVCAYSTGTSNTAKTRNDIDKSAYKSAIEYTTRSCYFIAKTNKSTAFKPNAKASNKTALSAAVAMSKEIKVTNQSYTKYYKLATTQKILSGTTLTTKNSAKAMSKDNLIKLFDNVLKLKNKSLTTTEKTAIQKLFGTSKKLTKAKFAEFVRIYDVAYNK